MIQIASQYPLGAAYATIIALALLALLVQVFDRVRTHVFTYSLGSGETSPSRVRVAHVSGAIAGALAGVALLLVTPLIINSTVQLATCVG